MLFGAVMWLAALWALVVHGKHKASGPAASASTSTGSALDELNKPPPAGAPTVGGLTKLPPPGA